MKLKVRLMPKPRQLNGVAGTVLRPSTSTHAEYAGELVKLTEQMTQHVTEELRKLFSGQAADILDDTPDNVTTRIAREAGLLEPVLPEVYAMDTSIAELSARLMRKMIDRFEGVFSDAAIDMSKRMVDRTLENSAAGLKTSLREISKARTLDTSILTDRLKVTVEASIADSVGLIKRVPEKYLSEVNNAVMRSITTGNGLQDLVPELEKQNIQVRNWATNTALDQTRKVYGNINKERMKASGVRQFEWVHSGGSNQPREQHMSRNNQPEPGSLDGELAGLNGGIFDFDNLPVIDPRTGERGIPGQTYNCHCTMRPIVTFDTGD